MFLLQKIIVVIDHHCINLDCWLTYHRTNNNISIENCSDLVIIEHMDTNPKLV